MWGNTERERKTRYLDLLLYKQWFGCSSSHYRCTHRKSYSGLNALEGFFKQLQWVCISPHITSQTFTRVCSLEICEFLILNSKLLKCLVMTHPLAILCTYLLHTYAVTYLPEGRRLYWETQFCPVLTENSSALNVSKLKIKQANWLYLDFIQTYFWLRSCKPFCKSLEAVMVKRTLICSCQSLYHELCNTWWFSSKTGANWLREHLHLTWNCKVSISFLWLP